ncbi:hypothetical protein MPSEU_000590200 [Mayamaea pseudoterrestris]|nr:hypothetical protein MPSEU_000590200 [Mayamaea pseudoterrestris]
MFDHGLHYLEREKHKIRPEYAATLQVLFRNVSLVLWRETSTQHYATPGGYYTESLPNQTECSAADDLERNSTSYHLASVCHMVHDMNWTLVDALAPNFTNSPIDADRHEIVMIPFRQYTLPLHNLHAGYPDCSHYCSSPFLWVPIWRGLRLALDRSVLNGKFQKVANEVIP